MKTLLVVPAIWVTRAKDDKRLSLHIQENKCKISLCLKGVSIILIQHEEHKKLFFLSFLNQRRKIYRNSP